MLAISAGLYCRYLSTAALETAAMGRPPLKVRKTTIRLPEDIFDRITALVGDRRMAEFIRDAVVAEVERREASVQSPPSIAKD